MSTRRPPLLTLTAFVAFCAALLIVGTGCTSTQVEEFKAAANEARQASAALDEVIAELQGMLAAAAPEDAAVLQSGLDTAVAEKARIDRVADDYLAKIDDITDPIDLAAQGLKSVSPAVPQPWGLWLGVAGTVLGGVSEARRRRLKKAAENVVVSIEETKIDEQIDFKIGAAELRSRMTPQAREFVDQARLKARPRQVEPLLPFTAEEVAAASNN